MFSVYLREISQKVNDTFYKLILKYVICYRECANRHGWSKLEEKEKEVLAGLAPANNNDQTAETVKTENSIAQIDFCQVNNAEHIPDL